MFWKPKARERDLERELRSDLDLEAAERRENGSSPEEARMAARKALGNVTSLKEEVREMWGWMWLERLGQDLRFALRGFRKSKGFTAAVIAILALGTGANSAIFSIFDAVLLRPLPFQNPDRVMLVFEKIPKRGVRRSDLAAGNFFDLQERSRSFSSMALLSGKGFALTDDSSPEEIPGALVSASFFSVLGVSPRLGRAFGVEDEEAGRQGVAVLSYRLWERRFGGDPDILGKTILLNGSPNRVVGVMPEGFQALFRDQELWAPMQLTPEERSDRTSHYLSAIGRLKEGVTPQQAQAELDAIGLSLEREHPTQNTGRGLTAARVHDELVGDTKQVLFLLMGSVSLLLLVACVNVANLLLARALGRRREIAVRVAIGASRQRLFRQLLTEGFLLAALGVTAGLVLANLMLRLLPLIMPPDSSLPGIDRISIDAPVWIAALVMTTCITAMFGCIPAMQFLRSGSNALGSRGATSGDGNSAFQLRSALLAVEIALSLVLILGAGLLLRSFHNLMHVEPGFQPQQVLAVQLQIPAQIQSPQQQAVYFGRIQERVRAVPGVQAVAGIDYLPLSGSGVTRRALAAGQPPPEPGGELIVQRHLVTPNYFRTMGIPLFAGRDFHDGDANSSRPIVIVSEALAQRYWPKQNALGQYIRLGVQATVANNAPREIVGIVGNVRHTSLRTEVRDEVYVPWGQEGWPVIHLVAQSSRADVASLEPEIRSAIWSVDKNQPLPNLEPVSRIVADSVWEPRLNTTVLTLFAAVTLILALTGVYGLMARLVGDRTAEIGIRMAMGARPRSVIALVLSQAFGPVLAGVLVGLALAFAGGRLIATQLYGVASSDPVTFVAAVLLIVTAALLAMAGPALRASKVDPMTALRHE